MSLITFVLLRCLSLGLDEKNQFTPGYIEYSIGKCFMTSLLEVIVVKIVFCFLDGIRVTTFDLVSHLNYRYCTYIKNQYSSLCALVIFNILTNNLFSIVGTIYILAC